VNPLLQWAIPIIIGIITFLAGQAFERRKLAQANRLKLLEPIEEWMKLARRFIGIIGDDITAVADNLPMPTTYNNNDRRETAIGLQENKEKVLGILKSKALNTRGTQKISKNLSETMNRISSLIENGLIQGDVQMLEKMNLGLDTSKDIKDLFEKIYSIKPLIEDAHANIAQLKVLYT
jgi:hypothetical protein